ncbi:type IV toxin-antitoxin system AbiEi family antitoxin domain-containing protein [Amycolatopsis nalaikhensis]|uniref:Type IV toxin-antitoxin system AbiEi family antitoxin domain-containing protein n=1 Tax=Amycolatopsis nalaikhensis TaxID=715472 RepID=A0ABY8XUH6_9PSEU|nr:type IV toxin-antitoxin system AbiEi family antitoxin domain-containing protein [Amycolatopsis sp. 2-2]WIV59127.1 type IV toxin-antitoxin system AbiEi family antitoxin domain-containing protein [Amycolatopsis sp. 2-2]
MEMGPAFELLGAYTADQWGMVTSRQAKSLGVDASTLHRLETAGYLDRVRHGVYAATSATVTPAREAQAAWLALNPAVQAWARPPLDPNGGVLSHQSAAGLHGLGELVDDRICFTTPRRRTSRDPDLWFKRAELADDDVMVIDGLPVTTPLRTVCDLLDQHIDGSHIATIIRQAVLVNQVGLDVLAERIGSYALRYGVRRPGDGAALLEHLLAEIGTSTAELARRPAPASADPGAALSALLAAHPEIAMSSTARVAKLVADAGIVPPNTIVSGLSPDLLAMLAQVTSIMSAVSDKIGPIARLLSDTGTPIATLVNGLPPDLLPAVAQMLKDRDAGDRRKQIGASANEASTIGDDEAHASPAASAHPEKLLGLPEGQGAERGEEDEP